MELQPLFEFQVLIHPAPTRVENNEAELQRPSIGKVLFDQLLPLELNILRNTRIPVSRQIDEVEFSVDPVKIYQLCATRFCTRKGQPLLARQAIQQTRLAYITSAQKSDFRERLSRKLLRPRCANHKFGVHQALNRTQSRETVGA